MFSATLDPTPNLTRLQRRRLSWRVAQGAPLQKAAERAGLKDDDAEVLLVCPDFGQMVEDYRALVAMPTEERMRRLVEAALMVLDEAMRRHDPRAAFFILKQQLLGRCPARDLARGVMRALERPPPTPKAPGDPPDPPREPAERRPVPAIDRAAYAAAASLCARTFSTKRRYWPMCRQRAFRPWQIPKALSGAETTSKRSRISARCCTTT